jgi:hypothetical protein
MHQEQPALWVRNSKSKKGITVGTATILHASICCRPHVPNPLEFGHTCVWGILWATVPRTAWTSPALQWRAGSGRARPREHCRCWHMQGAGTVRVRAVRVAGSVLARSSVQHRSWSGRQPRWRRWRVRRCRAMPDVRTVRDIPGLRAGGGGVHC